MDDIKFDKDRIKTVNGVISSIKKESDGRKRYTVFSKKILELYTKTELQLYDEVNVSYKISNGIVEVVSLETKSERNEFLYGKILNENLEKLEIDENIKIIKTSKASEVNELDSVTANMLNKIKLAAYVFAKSILTGAPIVVKFHSDGDGATGAIGLYKSIEKIEKEFFETRVDIRWFANRTIAYSPESFYMDSIHFKSYRSIEKPVICIIDFGTTEESNAAVDMINEEIEVVWLDHHPINDKFKGIKFADYINPINFGGNSDMAAGFLACIFAESIQNIDLDVLKEASLISDFSAYANRRNHEANKYATILDFVTGVKDSIHYLDGPLTPKYLTTILENKEKRESIYNYANNIIDEAIKLGIEKSKQYKRPDGITINVVDFEHVAKKYSGYLLPGRYSSKLQGHLESKNLNGNITLVTFRNYISIRLGKRIAEKVKLLDIIEMLKDTSGLVDSGGGHNEAASIRVSEENRSSVINLLLDAFGVKKSN